MIRPQTLLACAHKKKRGKIKPQANCVKDRAARLWLWRVQLCEKKTEGQSFSTAAFICRLTSSVNDRFSRGTLAISHTEGDLPDTPSCCCCWWRWRYKTKNPTEALRLQIPDLRYKPVENARIYVIKLRGYKDAKSRLRSQSGPTNKHDPFSNN